MTYNKKKKAKLIRQYYSYASDLFCFIVDKYQKVIVMAALKVKTANRYSAMPFGLKFYFVRLVYMIHTIIRLLLHKQK